MDSGYPSGFDVACGRHSYVLLVWTRMSALLWLDAGMVRGHSKREELQALNEIPDLSRTKFRESYTLELSLWFQNTWMDWSEWPWDTLTMHLLSFRTVAKGYLLTPGNCPPPKKKPTRILFSGPHRPGKEGAGLSQSQLWVVKGWLSALGVLKPAFFPPVWPPNSVVNVDYSQALKRDCVFILKALILCLSSDCCCRASFSMVPQ